MDSNRDESSSDERENFMDNNESQDKSNHQHHSNHQIQKLESYFNECPHPDDLQRRQLGEELNLKPKQIQFWFQNKRTQVKIQNEKAENAELRIDNIKIKRENEAMEEALETVLCPPCGGRHPGREDESRYLKKLRSENTFLKREHERLSSYVSQHRGCSIPSVDALPYQHGPSTYGSTSNGRASYGTSSNHIPKQSSLLRRSYTRENINNTPPPNPRKPLLHQHFQPLSQPEKTVMFETGAKAVAEVMSLIQMEDSMWVNSCIDGRLVIDQGNYEKIFTKSSYLKSISARSESSKEVVVVQMDARNLVDMFFDTEKWARLFPTIVTKAKTIHVLDSMDNRTQSFSEVIYEQLHILSPLVPPREFIILRTCQQMEEDLWLIADVSCHLPNVEFEPAPICTKRPSGVLIQALPNGRSKVTWIEHVGVNDKVRPHKLYRDLLYGGFGYGARRWTVTLQRMCERLSLYSMSDFPAATDYAGVVKTVQGRRRIMNLGERMIKNFAWIVKTSDKLDISQQSESDNNGVRMSVRRNTEDGEPTGLIVCASSSLCLPHPPLQVYDLLRNLEVRHEWDALSAGNPVTEAARFVTGTDQKNNVSLLRASSEGGDSELMILQDCFIDALGGMVVFAPLHLTTAYFAISGKVDPSIVSILPSGFIISRGSRPSVGEIDGGSMTLLSMAFQSLVFSGLTDSTDLNLEGTATTVNTLITSTVRRVKAMLNCE